MVKNKADNCFVVTYRDPKDGQVISLKAKDIRDSSLGLSFVAISDFVFDTKALVITPEEESLKKRLENVKSLHLSIYTILSIAEIGLNHKGLAFKKDKSNLLVLPTGDATDSPVKK